jgi:hypothetical protein
MHVRPIMLDGVREPGKWILDASLRQNDQDPSASTATVVLACREYPTAPAADLRAKSGRTRGV